MWNFLGNVDGNKARGRRGGGGRKDRRAQPSLVYRGESPSDSPPPPLPRFTAPASGLNLNISSADELFRELPSRKSPPRPQSPPPPPNELYPPFIALHGRIVGNCFIGIGGITKSLGVVLRTNKTARDSPAKLISALRFHPGEKC